MRTHANASKGVWGAAPPAKCHLMYESDKTNKLAYSLPVSVRTHVNASGKSGGQGGGGAAPSATFHLKYGNVKTNMSCQ